jgi:cell division protein FtsL
MRLLSLLSFGFLAGLVVLIYDMKYETRQLQTRAAELERAISEENDNLALMRTEWSHVTSPDRVEKLARERLELQPARPDQLIANTDFLALLVKMPPPAEQRPLTPQQDHIGALIRGTGLN